MINGFEKFKLSNEIYKGLDDLGFKKPTEIQKEVIGEALLNKDLIVKSQTGSGKTGAFAIPLCEKVVFDENIPKILVLAPTRELVLQIKEDISNIGRYKKVKVVTLVGKESFKEQRRMLGDKCHIVVGTPGRVLDHLDEGSLNGKFIDKIVIDEADEMFNMGFIKQVSGVFRRISKKRVTMMFSATYPKEILELSKRFMDRPVNIEIKKKSVSNDNISHGLIEVEGIKKLDLLNEILLKEVPTKVIIFCRTKENVEKACCSLKDKGYSVEKIHGDMLQKERVKKMNDFKEGEFRILVATDIAARGIDVEGISHVINLDIPVEKEAYVHRIGRTGRNGGKGKSITFKTPFEDKYLNRIEEYIGFNIEEYVEDIGETNLLESTKILKSKPEKSKKKELLNKKVTKIYLNGGKKKKIRKVDIVGTILSIEGINLEDIGIIEIKDICSYVDILNGKGSRVLNGLKNKKIKGKILKVEIAK